MKQCRLIVAVLLMALCLSACAADPSKDFAYELLDDGTVQITKYTGDAKTLTVPEKLDGYQVSSIGDRAFEDCESLTSIIIPSGVTNIGKYAFSSCSSLTSITLPESMTSIGERAFMFCKALTSITIPEGVKRIEENVFYYCESLTSVTIPNSVEKIDRNPFYTCHQLSDIRVSQSHPTLATIDGVLFYKPDKVLICYPRGLAATSYAVPDGIRRIGHYAMANKYLTSITLPDSLTSIGTDAFTDCPGHLTFTVPMDSYAEQWCIDNNMNYTFPDANDWLLN